MAEFSKVTHEWVRMCKAYSDAGDCMKCPMVTNPICGCMSDDNGASEKDIAKAEADIMSWAAEHPEPTYPTWREYLQKQGVLDVEYIPATSNTTSTPKSYVQTVKTLAPFYRSIPADIAQKLGIEPKEAK